MPRTVVYRNISGSRYSPVPVVAVLGNMDGLHLGHQALLKEVLKKKQEIFPEGAAKSVVISLYPHPDLVLGRASERNVLTTVRQKTRILSSIGVDALCLIHFTKAVAELSAYEFIEKELFHRLNVQHLVMGADARIGGGTGLRAQEICEYFRNNGRSAEIAPFVADRRGKISSGRIRDLVRDGEVSKVSQLLGRNFSLEGRVISGEHRGRTLGFPTANLYTRRQIIPANGVYATRVYVSGKVFSSVTNIGFRPTFSCDGLSIESHIMEGFTEQIYGKRIEVEFVKRLRPEMKFGSVSELVEQIGKDIKSAITLLRK